MNLAACLKFAVFVGDFRDCRHLFIICRFSRRIAL
jgi:hypothetical protein